MKNEPVDEEQSRRDYVAEFLADPDALRLEGAGSMAIKMAGIADNLDEMLKAAQKEIAEAIATCKEPAEKETNEPEWRVRPAFAKYKRSKQHLWTWFGNSRYYSLCGYFWHQDNTASVDPLPTDQRCKHCLAIKAKPKGQKDG